MLPLSRERSAKERQRMHPNSPVRSISDTDPAPKDAQAVLIEIPARWKEATLDLVVHRRDIASSFLTRRGVFGDLGDPPVVETLDQAWLLLSIPAFWAIGPSLVIHHIFGHVYPDLAGCEVGAGCRGEVPKPGNRVFPRVPFTAPLGDGFLEFGPPVPNQHFQCVATLGSGKVSCCWIADA